MTQRKTTPKRFFIIDGYALLFRAHFALIHNPLVTSYGLNTSALFGFVNQIFKLIRNEKPDYIVCAFDSKGKTFRHDMYKDYKANRPEMPDDLQAQLPHLWDLLKALNLPVIKKSGVEADDIIGTLVVEAEKYGLVSYIVSGDKDFMQLINDKIFLYAPGTKKSPVPIIYDSKKVIDRWGVPPEKIIDLLGLMGDSSDNIPGVAGVGEKTAVKLIKEYGSLEGALENAELVKNKRAQNGLKDGIENAILSKKLATILLDVELKYCINDLKAKSIDIISCEEKFKELEFHALNKLLDNGKNDGDKPIKTDKPQKDYKIVLDIENLDKLIQKLSRTERISINLNTTCSKPMEAEIVGISFSIKSNEGWYIPIIYPEKKKNNFGDDDSKFVLNRLKRIFEDESKFKTAKNIKYCAQILKRFGITLEDVTFDITIASHLLNPLANSTTLSTLSMEYFNYEMITIDELIGKGKNKYTMDQVPLKELAFYSMEYADILLQLTDSLDKKLRDNGLIEYFYKIEMPLLFVLMEMEYYGAYVAPDLLKSMSDETGDKLDSLISSIYSLAGTEFNINSTQQLANILFDNLKLPQIKKRSTAENVLRQLQSNHDIPKLVLEYRKYNKLKNTYLDSLPVLINKETDRIHSTFNQTIAATGRLTSTNPNFQNIPIRTDEGKEIRKAFRPQFDDWKIFSFDYSQIELRIMAHFSKDIGLINAFKNNEDIHSRTASNVFNVPIDSISDSMRRTAKVVNFGIMYGAGPFRMSQELGITRKEAIEIIESYFIQYPGIKNYISSTLEKARKFKYVETIQGRRRPVWDADSDNILRRQAAERMAINMPIQGSAAEMIKLAMIGINTELEKQNYKSKLILQIHDELLFEYPADEENTLLKLVVDKMENAMQLSIPIVVDYGNGYSWYDAH